VVFDIGNVLVRWDPRNLYRRMGYPLWRSESRLKRLARARARKTGGLHAMSSSTLNLVGLSLNFIGAMLLVFFTSPALMVTKDGKDIIGLTNEPKPEVIKKNKRLYQRHQWGFTGGTVLLSAGFLLQLWAELMRP
jgi:hypothetical protein